MKRVVALMLVCLLAAGVMPVATAADDTENLLPNGDFEQDTDGNGVPDGWVGGAHHFSHETWEGLQAFIKNFPSHAEILKSEEIRAFDGRILQRREAGKPWPPTIRDPSYHNNLVNDGGLLWGSRFGSLPVPEALPLGDVTLVGPVVPAVVSEPVSVKPNTGYRLSYWFRTAGSLSYAFQILDAEANMRVEWPKDQVVTSLSLGWTNVAPWTRYELPFRTGPEQTAIRIRPWLYLLDASRWERIYLDDFRLVEDDSVVVGDISDPVNPPPQWPAEAVKRGFAVVPRPTLPQTFDTYQPLPEEIDQPLVITAAPGQTASGVLYLRALRELGGPLVVGPKRSQFSHVDGWGQLNWWRHVQLRVCHPLQLRKNRCQWEMRPHFLMPGLMQGTRPKVTNPAATLREARVVEVQVPEGEGRSVWLTVFVPQGAPPGDYNGEIQVVAPGSDGYALPFTIRVCDIDLPEPDIDFGMYRTTMVRADRHIVVPGDDQYAGLADNRRHGMTSVDQGGGPVWVYEDADGRTRINWIAFDQGMEQMVRAGFRKRFHYYPNGDAMRPDVQLAILERCREKGWPEPLFYVYDEPGARGRALLDTMEREFGAARRQGLRTVTSGLDWRTQGEAYDVWIMDLSNVGGKDWEAIRAAAAKHGAELQAYDCSGELATHPRNIRFYTGLWTWAAGLKGNWIWEYAQAGAAGVPMIASLSDAEPPSGWASYGFVFSLPSGWGASTSWEARREGVDDYRYLRALEIEIERAENAGGAGDSAVAVARQYLSDLRQRVPLDAFSRTKRRSTALKQFDELAPEIGAEEYDALQSTCSKYVIAIRQALDP